MTLPDINPVFLQIGPLAFRWYGLMYLVGFSIGYFIILRKFRDAGIAHSREEAADLVFTLALGVILGGRIGYILFYDLQQYLAHPLEVFAVWHGGMSFHGGTIGIITAGFLYSRKKNIPFFTLGDVVVQAGTPGLGFGRIGNFINGELYGRVTDVPWGVIFRNGGPLPRHPSQLYEALLEGPVLFLFLSFLWKKKLPPGVVFWSFVAGYGLIRFSLEFVREPDAQIGFFPGGFTMGQLLSFPMLVGGAVMALLFLRRTAR